MLTKLSLKLFSSQHVSMSDEDLMRLIQAGNTNAFDELYSRYKSPLYSYLSRLLNSSIAEELLQEIFLKLINRKDSFRFDSSVKTWLWTIARNTLIDHWRGLDHRMKNSFESLQEIKGEESIESPLDNVETALLKKISREQLIACISELPEAQQEIVLLHIHAELSNQEIADQVKMGLGAVKTVLFRSKEKLIDCFKRGGHL
ncbi:MAG: sigma-70 family RNA polymerase sigma factor [Rhizobacter sp.]|nr:sigma-70 family RNA polymerase sigma factor [Bacteriovorax sp.]